MKSALPPLEEKAAAVEAMFDRIAPVYDRLNRLLTLRLDQGWRRRALTLAGVGPGTRVIDLGCGTGDLCELAAARGARVLGIDVSAGMLRCARQRRVPAGFVRADAGVLPVGDGAADVVVSGFALRNFVSIPQVLVESARILRPGGRLALLEVDEPSLAPVRWGHGFYFRRVVPWIGGLLGDRRAYAYLPESTTYLPPERELGEILRSSGFRDVRKVRLLLGTAQILTAVRA